eukprot:6621654-Prymnesium_polylepis.1
MLLFIAPRSSVRQYGSMPLYGSVPLLWHTSSLIWHKMLLFIAPRSSGAPPRARGARTQPAPSALTPACVRLASRQLECA